MNIDAQARRELAGLRISNCDVGAIVRRSFGQVSKLRSGRYQARWRFNGKYYTARRESDGGSLTFSTEKQAEGYLEWVRREIEAGRWAPPTTQPPAVPTLREYAESWLKQRGVDDTTYDHYEQLLRDHIFPTFGDTPITAITPRDVRDWHATVARAKGKIKDRPTARAHAYGLLRTIMNTAVDDELITANPCRVRGAGQSKRAVKIRPASLPELEALVTALPDRYKLLALFASWCALRFGELAEIRRSDVDLTNGIVYVRRGVVRTKRAKNGRKVKGPKSEAGKRPVNIPPHLLPLVREHIANHAEPGRNGLLFPAANGGHLAPSTLYRVYYPAREAAGRPDLRFHDLRHTGATLAAATGATLAELMARLGHSTPGAAMRYQHAAQDRDKVIAEALSELANGAAR